MTQEVYIWGCSGKDETAVAAIMEEAGGLIDTRKKGNTFISQIWMSQEYGDRVDFARWIYTGRKSYEHARRTLDRCPHYFRLKEWILRQEAPVVLLTPMDDRNKELGTAWRLGELLEQDGFILGRWDKRRPQESGQQSLFA